MKLKKDSAIHPFLFAVFFIIVLYSLNFYEVTPDVIILPIVISLLITTGLLIIIGYMLKNNTKAGLIVSLLLIITFSFGHIRNILLDSSIDDELVRIRYILPIVVGILIIGTISVIRTSKKLDNTTKIVNVIAITLIILTIFNFAEYQDTTDLTTIQQRFASDNDIELDFNTEISTNHENNRDIYYIILDAYANAETLKRVFDFDNTEFLSKLKAHGFFVPDAAHSNYLQTTLSLGSSLNMGYINNVTQSGYQGPHIPRYLTDNNIVMQKLQSKGYTTYSTIVESVRTLDIADVTICTDNTQIYSSFNIRLLQSTTLSSLLSVIIADHKREQILCAFDEMLNIPTEAEKPVFVFAHILSPHGPFVFGPNGEELNQIQLGASITNKKGYVDQVKFLNTKILRLIDGLLESENKPIIIVQADHGSASTLDWDPTDEYVLKERHGILSAYHFPDGGNEILYNSITPVNNFRIMLNHYFDEDYEILEDKLYYSTYENPYHFEDVTNIVR